MPWRLRHDLEEQGAIFQSTSDSEVILHLLARSQQTDILEALKETLSGRFRAHSPFF